MPLKIRDATGRTIYKIKPVTPNKPDLKNIMEPNNQEYIGHPKKTLKKSEQYFQQQESNLTES